MGRCCRSVGRGCPWRFRCRGRSGGAVVGSSWQILNSREEWPPFAAKQIGWQLCAGSQTEELRPGRPEGLPRTTAITKMAVGKNTGAALTVVVLTLKGCETLSPFSVGDGANYKRGPDSPQRPCRTQNPCGSRACPR